MIKTTTFATLAVIVIAGAAALEAQGSSSQAQTPITVTGCIQKAEPAAATTAPAAGEQKAGFVLANARPGKADEAVGTSGSASSTKYPLDADAAQLDPHVGHKVEITGTFQPNTTGAPPTMKVQSVKMVSASCDQAPKAQ
jgi:hypothetical protein